MLIGDKASPKNIGYNFDDYVLGPCTRYLFNELEGLNYKWKRYIIIFSVISSWTIILIIQLFIFSILYFCYLRTFKCALIIQRLFFKSVSSFLFFRMGHQFGYHFCFLLKFMHKSNSLLVQLFQKLQIFISFLFTY